MIANILLRRRHFHKPNTPARRSKRPWLEVELLEDRLTPTVATPSQNFVSQVYLELLGRQVDPAGLQYFSNQVDSGVSRTVVALEIEQSPEFLTRQINLLYQNTLNRSADPGGLNYDLAYLQSGGKIERVLINILSSPEFFQKNGGTNDGWLTGAYAALDIGNPLGTVDSAGRMGWDAAFAGGVPYQEVASLLVNGIQYERNTVSNFYLNDLHRGADTGGLNHWAVVDQIAGQGNVQADIIGSQEYFQDAQSNPATPFPTVTSFAPTTGAVGSTVVITGTFLNNATGLTIAGANIPSSSFTINSATQITAVIPAGATAGTGPVTVTTPFGPGTSAANFTIGPAITSFSPSSGPQGTTITITGTNFTGATAVTIAGLTVPAGGFSVVDDQHITATVPTGGTAGTTGPITVTTSFGSATSATDFTLGAPGAPSFVANPNNGQAGAVITLNGTNLFGVTSVTFNGVAATIVPGSNTSTQVQVNVPASTNGNIVVTTTPGNTGSAFFSYQATITGFNPGSVGQGNTLTINGTNLLGATGVVFTGTSTVVVPTNVTNTSLQVVAPSGATTGVVQVTTGAGTFASATSLTVIPPPSLNGNPTGDNEHATVTINGSNLSNATVTFGATTATIQTNTATTIVFDLVSITNVVKSSLPAGGSFGFTVSTPGGSVNGTFIFNGETDGDTIYDAIDDVIVFP